MQALAVENLILSLSKDEVFAALERIFFRLNHPSHSPVSPAKAGAQVKPTSRSG